MTSVEKGNENAKFTFTGFTADDGYYLAITILQKQRAAATAEWHLNDNLEMNLFIGDTGSAIGFSIFDDFICAHGAVAQYAMRRTTIDDNGYTVKTEIELFIAHASPKSLVTFNVGCNGNGFGGWQSLAWGAPGNRIKLTDEGASVYTNVVAEDGVTLDGSLNEEFWQDVTVWNNKNCESYSINGVYALVQAQKGNRGVYIGVTMYHNKADDYVIQGNGLEWWNYLNIEFRFVKNDVWDSSVQRAASVFQNEAIGCQFGRSTSSNSDEGLEAYAYKTVFEIFVDYDWVDGVTAENDTPLWIACVAETNYNWLLEFNQDKTLPTVLTSEGFVRK